MKCPACFNQLSELKVGECVVDVCRGGCGGIWFDAFELQKVDQESETAGNQLLHIERDPQVIVDPSRKRECPRCEGVKLMRHYYSAKRRVEVDHCPNCAGYWLDARELAHIRAEKAQSAAGDDAETRDKNISIEVIRYLYRLQNRIGQNEDKS